MKAYVRTNAENQEVVLSEVSIYDIEANEVLIKTEAFGVGIHDRYFIPQDVEFPHVIGSEGAGTIVKLGSEVSDYVVGDRVIFTTALQAQGGAWAEYAAAKAEALLPLPEELTFAEGAALPIAGKTALASMAALELMAGDKVFIAGASGAIGSLVIQLADLAGVQVSASASKKNHQYMQSLGAKKTVDYHDSDWPAQIKEWSGGGVQAALAIQPGTGADSIKAVENSGRLITVSGDNDQITPERNITVKQIEHHSESKGEMTRLLDQVAKQEIQLTIEKMYDFEVALDALEKTEIRHAQGKVVVKM